MRAVPLTPALLDDFLSRPMRPDDAEEWVDGLGMTVQEALPVMLDWDAYNRAVVTDTGECVCVFGCNVVPGGQWGIIWLVASAYDLSLAPLVHRAVGIEEMPRLVALAGNLVAWPSSKNTVHHRWLEHFGFVREGEVVPAGRTVPFIKYVRRKADVL